jgi:hypothetical protein
MPAIQPLSVMLHALSYAAVPAWPLGVTAALAWPGRVELLLLSVAGAGTSSALTLSVLRWAEARLARRGEECERLMAQRDAQYARLEGLLCGTLVSNLRPRDRDAAKTLPDLRVLRPGARPPGVQARR